MLSDKFILNQTQIPVSPKPVNTNTLKHKRRGNTPKVLPKQPSQPVVISLLLTFPIMKYREKGPPIAFLV